MEITAVGSFPIGMVFDGTNLRVVVFGSAVVKMQPSTGAVLATYGLGLDPFQPAFDGANLWVPNDGDGTVGRIPSTK